MTPIYRRAHFADTSFFYVLVDRGSHGHGAAVSLMTHIEKRACRLVTTNFVVAATHALLLARLGREVAWRWLEAVAGFALVERLTQSDEDGARAIIARYADKSFSYTDAATFAFMDRCSITVALSLDEHFVQYGQFLVMPHTTTELPPGF